MHTPIFIAKKMWGSVVAKISHFVKGRWPSNPHFALSMAIPITEEHIAKKGQKIWGRGRATRGRQIEKIYSFAHKRKLFEEKIHLEEGRLTKTRYVSDCCVIIVLPAPYENLPNRDSIKGGKRPYQSSYFLWKYLYTLPPMWSPLLSDFEKSKFEGSVPQLFGETHCNEEAAN